MLAVYTIDDKIIKCYYLSLHNTGPVTFDLKYMFVRLEESLSVLCLYDSKDFKSPNICLMYFIKVRNVFMILQRHNADPVYKQMSVKLNA